MGLSGIAIGNHLHFEVRLGENTYLSVRNPELWLIPSQDEDGVFTGGLAGIVLDEWGPVELSEGMVLQRLPEGPEGPVDLKFFTMSYEKDALIGQAPFGESFAIGDLPAGLYRISFPSDGVREFIVEILPGKLTMVVFDLRGAP